MRPRAVSRRRASVALATAALALWPAEGGANQEPSLFADAKDPAGGNRRRAAHANRLARQAFLTEKIRRTQYGEHRLLPLVRDHNQSHFAFLEVVDGVCRITLRKDSLLCLVLF